jgi:hypothetical protein
MFLISGQFHSNLIFQAMLWCTLVGVYQTTVTSMLEVWSYGPFAQVMEQGVSIILKLMLQFVLRLD